MKKLASLKNYLSKSKIKSVVITHFKPDADALGSSLGLARYLANKKHSCQVITPSGYPQFLAWMPGSESVLAIQHEADREQAKKLIEEAEMIFCVDFSSLNRAHSLAEPIRQSSAKKVMIDHHLEPDKFADFEQWNPSSASAAGLVFDLIKKLGDRAVIDASIANCLYAGLMTDTGGFRHPNTTQKEFLIAADLVKLGADPAFVSKMIYDSFTLDKLRFTGYTLQHKIKLIPEYRTAYMALKIEDFKLFNSQVGDTEGLVNYGLSISGIQLSVLAYESKSEIKMSFRSLGELPANEIAKLYFNGGGHRNAAGGTSKESLEATINRFIEVLPNYKKYL